MPRKSTAAADGRTKRTYLSRDARRQALLAAAAEIVERQGWPALSMSALAEQAGTSRQLVYQHFPNLEKLLADTAWFIFLDTLRGTRASIEANPSNLAEAARAAETVSLDLPDGRGDALWQLIAGTAAPTPELDRMRRQMRELISGLWTPVVRQQLGLEPKDARAYAWMVTFAFWGMRQLVRDGALDRHQGLALFNQLVERVSRR